MPVSSANSTTNSFTSHHTQPGSLNPKRKASNSLDLGFKTDTNDVEMVDFKVVWVSWESRKAEALQLFLTAIDNNDLSAMQSASKKLDELGYTIPYNTKFTVVTSLTTTENYTALEYAAKLGHEKIVEFLLPKVTVNKKPCNDNMHSAFHLANDTIQNIIIEAITFHKYAVEIYKITNHENYDGRFVTLQHSKDYLSKLMPPITTSTEAVNYCHELSAKLQIGI